ncbi:MAG: DUF4087 domain-containing protein [Pseudomonadota bacterium]
MRNLILALVAASTLLPVQADGGTREKRCGWIANPTPANWNLFDREGRWSIGEQGRHQARGLRTMPDFDRAEWVTTNVGSYGHGCGCMTVDTDAKTKRVTRIYVTQQQKLAICRADRKLPQW